MTLAEIYNSATALAPKCVESTGCSTYSGGWTFSDNDGDAMEINIYKTGELLFVAHSDSEIWHSSPDFLMWLGMLGGLMLELDK